MAGVESDAARFRAAQRIRAALVATWPDLEHRYKTFEGFYPEGLNGTDWFGPDAILVFTNVGSGWNEEALEAVIQSMPRFGEALLDLRLFGWIRESEEERVALFNRILSKARWAERLPYIAKGNHLARFVFVRIR